jgi:hypothetical protein
MKSDSNLRAIYRGYNKLYFGNKLTKRIKIVYKASFDTEGGRRCRNHARFVYEPYYAIEIDPTLRKDPKKRNGYILHEMCHVATVNEPSEHGRGWLKEVRRIEKLTHSPLPR